MMQSSWDILKKRAENYSATSAAAISSGNADLVQNALENMHFAVELSMKAAIAKNGGNYPDYGRRGHDLEGLAVHKFGDGVNSILAAAKKSGANSLFNVGLSVWSMDCRYISMENHEDMKASINDYKELYQWIRDNLLK
jgi:hypothetical protein